VSGCLRECCGGFPSSQRNNDFAVRALRLISNYDLFNPRLQKLSIPTAPEPRRRSVSHCKRRLRLHEDMRLSACRCARVFAQRKSMRIADTVCVARTCMLACGLRYRREWSSVTLLCRCVIKEARRDKRACRFGASAWAVFARRLRLPLNRTEHNPMITTSSSEKNQNGEQTFL